MSQFEAFVNLELPRRPALLTVAIVSFDDDPNNPVAPPIIQLAPLGTYYQQENPNVKLWRKEPDGTWKDVGGGSVNAAGVTALVYRENHPSNGPFVFNDFVTLNEALLDLGLNAKKEIVFDDTLVTGTGMVLPPKPVGDYDFKTTNWGGISRPGGFGKTELRLGDGFTCVNPPGTFSELRLASLSNTVSPFKCVGGEAFFVREASDLSSLGTVPLFDLSALVPYDFISMEMSGTSTLAGTGTSGTPVVDMLTDKIVIARVTNGVINDEAFGGSGGATIGVEIWPGGVYSDYHPQFTGTFLENFVFVPPRIKYNSLPVTANLTMGINDRRDGFRRVDASAGVLDIKLPTQSNVFKNVGYLQGFLEISGANGFNIKPPAGKELNGIVDNTIFVPANGAILTTGDGNGNYFVMADYSGNAVFGGPVIPVIPPATPEQVNLEVGTAQSYDSVDPKVTGYFEIDPNDYGFVIASVNCSSLFSVGDVSFSGTVEIYNTLTNTVDASFNLTGAGSNVLQKVSAAIPVPTASTIYQIRIYTGNNGETIEFGGVQIRVSE